MDKYDQKWVSTVFGERRWAITLGQTTYYSVQWQEVDYAWRKHEDKHKQQWKQEGLIKFAVKYLWYQLIKGYKNNPYEIEARQAEQLN